MEQDPTQKEPTIEAVNVQTGETKQVPTQQVIESLEKQTTDDDLF